LVDVPGGCHRCHGRQPLRGRSGSKELIPWFDGDRLEDVIDYANYVIVPCFFLFRANLLPPQRRIVASRLCAHRQRLRLLPQGSQKPPTISSLVFRLNGTSLRLLPLYFADAALDQRLFGDHPFHISVRSHQVRLPKPQSRSIAVSPTAWSSSGPFRSCSSFICCPNHRPHLVFAVASCFPLTIYTCYRSGSNPETILLTVNFF